MKTKILLLSLIFLTLSGCIKLKSAEPVKNEEPKPPTTVNHFYFYIEKDGKDKLYIAEDYHGIGGYYSRVGFNEEAGANHQGEMLYGYKHNFFNIGLFFYGGITHTGPYTLKHSDEYTPEGAGGYTYLNQNQAFIYITNYPHDLYISEDNCGNMEITYLSPDKREFKGNFNMTLYSPVAQDSLVIKNGHFWVDLDKLN